MGVRQFFAFHHIAGFLFEKDMNCDNRMYCIICIHFRGNICSVQNDRCYLTMYYDLDYDSAGHQPLSRLRTSSPPTIITAAIVRVAYL